MVGRVPEQRGVMSVAGPAEKDKTRRHLPPSLLPSSPRPFPATLPGNRGGPALRMRRRCRWRLGGYRCGGVGAGSAPNRLGPAQAAPGRVGERAGRGGARAHTHNLSIHSPSITSVQLAAVMGRTRLRSSGAAGCSGSAAASSAVTQAARSAAAVSPAMATPFRARAEASASGIGRAPLAAPGCLRMRRPGAASERPRKPRPLGPRPRPSLAAPTVAWQRLFAQVHGPWPAARLPGDSCSFSQATPPRPPRSCLVTAARTL